MKLLLSKIKLVLCLIFLFVLCSGGVFKLNNIYFEPLIVFGCAYSSTREKTEDLILIIVIVPLLVAVLKGNEHFAILSFILILVFFIYRPCKHKQIKAFFAGYLLYFLMELIYAYAADVRYKDFSWIVLNLIITAALYNTLLFAIMSKVCKIWFPNPKGNIFI